MRRLVLASLLAFACAHGPASPLEVDLALAGENNPDAIANFKKGDAALNSDNWQDAMRYFEYVRNKYPYSALAPLAELRLADTHLSRERYTEAQDGFKTFVKLHPNHPRVDYAAYRAAYAIYQEVPSDFFLFPPAIEKEQVHARAAAKAFDAFLASYSNSKYVAEATKHRDECKKRLAEHELYVAGFYKKRNKLHAVAGRLEGLLRDYPGVPQEPAAMLELGRVWVELKEPDKGREVLRKLVEKYPKRSEAVAAQNLLKSAG